jgi:hypothetical protein
MPRDHETLTPATDTRLAGEIRAVLDEGDVGAPVAVVRNADSVVIAALRAAMGVDGLRRLRPQVLVASDLTPAGLSELGGEFEVRVAPAEMQSLLREQVIVGGLIWFGEAVATDAPRIEPEGRYFNALPKADWRGLRLVFDGLWIAAAPAGAPSAARASGQTYGGGYVGAAA